MELREDVMYQVARDVFETMTYTYDEVAKDISTAQDRVASAQINFEGPYNGDIRLTLPIEILPELSRNMMAEADDYEPPKQEQMDILGELANVIGGKLVSAMLGSKSKFKLYMPHVIEGSFVEDEMATPMKRAVKLWFGKGWSEVTINVY